VASTSFTSSVVVFRGSQGAKLKPFVPSESRMSKTQRPGDNLKPQ
jgi:pre-mRNA-splicing factor ATP-dependent RNA helicase DHX38/PRP16